MEDKKDLIIFDIDETITDPNSLLFSTEYLLSKEEKENIIKFVCKHGNIYLIIFLKN